MVCDEPVLCGDEVAYFTPGVKVSAACHNCLPHETGKSIFRLPIITNKNYIIYLNARRMKKIIPFLLLIILAGSCRKDIKGSSTLAGTWKLVTMEDITTRQLFTKDQVGEYDCAGHDVCDITLSITTDNAKTITGKTMVNDFSGNFNYDASKGTITLPGLASTKVGERPWGSAFLDGLRNAESYRVNATELHIEYANKTKRLNFVRQ